MKHSARHSSLQAVLAQNNWGFTFFFNLDNIELNYFFFTINLELKTETFLYSTCEQSHFTVTLCTTSEFKNPLFTVRTCKVRNLFAVKYSRKSISITKRLYLTSHQNRIYWIAEHVLKLFLKKRFEDKKVWLEYDELSHFDFQIYVGLDLENACDSSWKQTTKMTLLDSLTLKSY